MDEEATITTKWICRWRSRVWLKLAYCATHRTGGNLIRRGQTAGSCSMEENRGTRDESGCDSEDCESGSCANRVRTAHLQADANSRGEARERCR